MLIPAAPRSRSSATALRSMRSRVCPALRPIALERTEQFTEAMLERAAAVIPEFRERIVHVEAGSPITQKRYTLSSDGVAYGIDLSWQQFGPLRPASGRR